MPIRFSLLLLPILLLLLACGEGSSSSDASDNTAETIIYLTRHAEKGTGSNPDLLSAGVARANRLAQLLRKKDVRAVYATDFRRTQATASPLAAATGLSVRKYAASANPEKLTTEWLKKHRGETILVVGHSNTIPGLVNALIGESRYEDINEDDYRKLFRVTVDGEGKGRVEEMASSR
ncbi:SixA phosphatase family protein [Neolewinella persica]|uniref:SixA phosphatase family protein n=1 Tax=Neolewinella persica TaxID=70998 RepID=UPI00039DD317|nr:phosphoglycerate mutase family protein [Neolewinella persica]